MLLTALSAPKKPEEPAPYVIQKTALADKVASSKYGSAPPPVKPKHVAPPPAPLWTPSKIAPPILEIPEPVKPKQFSVPASGYGRVSPQKTERVDKELAPKWTPNSKKVVLGHPEPVKSKLYQNVNSSGYGSTYVPAGPGRESFDR